MSSSSNTSCPSLPTPMLEDDEIGVTPGEMSDDDDFTDGDGGICPSGGPTAEYWSPLPVLGILSKWTNLFHGWQERYFVLADGQLTYYRNAEEVNLGSRGSIRILSAEVKIHEYDDCRFEIHVGESIWYLRGISSTQRQTWIHAIERHRIAESGYGSERTLNRPTSLVSLASSSAAQSPSLTSTSSFKRGNRLLEKLTEMTTFKELLCKQVDTLQTYFDACSSVVQHLQQKESLTGPGILSSLSDLEDTIDEEEEDKRRPFFPPGGRENQSVTDISTSKHDNYPSPITADNGDGSVLKSANPVTAPANTGGFFSRFLPFRSAQGVHPSAATRKPESPVTTAGRQPCTDESAGPNTRPGSALAQLRSPLQQRHLNKAILQHSVMTVDFRKEGHVFKATTAGILTNLSNAVELMQRREEHWRRRMKGEVERYRRLEEQHRALAQELLQLRQLVEVSSALPNGISVASNPSTSVLIANDPRLSATSSPPAKRIPGSAAVKIGDSQQFCRQATGTRMLHTFDIAGPDYQEGPNSPIREEEFYDAIDAELDKIEQDQVRLEALKSVGKLLRSAQAMPNTHPLHDELEKAVDHRLRYVANADAFLPPGDRRIASRPSDSHPDGASTIDNQPATSDRPAVGESAEEVPTSSSDDWKVITQDGELIIYQRELETADGVVLDPLQAVHRVPNVTAREMCTYFWDVQYRMDWEFTIDQAPTVLEVCGDDTVVLHQLYKRVWPTTQRDAVFWSHIRQVSTRFPPTGSANTGSGRMHQRSFSMDCSSGLRPSATCSGDLSKIGSSVVRTPRYPPLNTEDSDGVLDSWMVVNMSTNYRGDRVPVSASPIIRLDLDVILYCQTVLSPPCFPGGTLSRDRLSTRLVYMANINPGGWVPAAGLRTLARREYPRFLQRFSAYVQQQTRDKAPLL